MFWDSPLSESFAGHANPKTIWNKPPGPTAAPPGCASMVGSACGRNWDVAAWQVPFENLCHPRHHKRGDRVSGGVERSETVLKGTCQAAEQWWGRPRWWNWVRGD